MKNREPKMILILGGGIMQLPAVRIAKRKGWLAFVAARDIEASVRSLADEVLEVDLRDKDAVCAAAAGLRERRGLDGIFTAGTDFSTTVAWVAERLKLLGIPYSIAMNATDKARMRACFRSKGLPGPRFFTLEKGRPWQRPADFPFPLVVKPVDNMGARGVRRVDEEQQLEQAVAAAIAQSRTEKAIVEEYLQGPELSLDAVVYRGKAAVCGVADRHICFPPFFVEMGHTMPSELEPAVLEGAQRVFKEGIRALGIRNGAAKGDIKLTSAGPVIGEIAARLSGGYMSGWTFPLSSGVEVTEAALNVAVGLPPGDITPRYYAVSAERAFISIPGRLQSLEGITEVRRVEGVEELFLRVHIGDRMKLPVNNLEKCGNVITRAQSRERAVAAAQEAIQRVFLRLKAGDEETERFLSGQEPGAWSAYSPVSERFARELAGMPAFSGQPGTLRRGLEGLAILRPPGLREEGSRDWHGLSLAAALEKVQSITGVQAAESPPPGKLALGRPFWNAMIRGSVQGAVYLIDTLVLAREAPEEALRRLRPGK